ncbi:methionyl-tRNA formyltransferase [Lacisediminihabitans sp. H27-G8]|uniref:methionyl-tRNA formyltransferase n=1 Tax=Lacisediminihabitans sp. H27-G8 TaxID=3111909 RepID=UPI0038FC44F6
MKSPRIAVLGTKTTCLRLVEALLADRSVNVAGIITLDDSTDSRSRLPDIIEAGKSRSCPTEISASPAAAYQFLLSLGVDLVLVAGWYRLIPSAVLQSIPQGFFGLHYSRLPSYRGSAPVVWAIMNGETRIGYSLFKMSDEMDEGPIAIQGSVPVDESMYVSDILNRLDHASSLAVAGAAHAIASGAHTLFQQTDESPSFSGARSPLDGRINWSQPASVIARAVRAQSKPYPGAFSTLKGERVVIWRASPDSDAKYYGAPGQVIRMIGSSPVIACGQSSGLILDEIESRIDPIRFSLLTSRFL